MTKHAKTNPTERFAGFSLMELLVVIAIIALLIGLLVAGMNVIRGGSKDSQTRAILAGLMGLAGNMETQLGDNGLMHLTSQDRTYDWTTNKRKNAPGTSGTGSLDDGDTTSQDNDVYMERAYLYTERFLWAANQMPAIRDKLASFGQTVGDANNNGFIDLVDPWGQPIAYANNVKHVNGVDEEDDFLPEYSGPFFASAGKDKQWGTPRVRGEFASDAAWQTFTEKDEYKFTLDNLYSFDIDRSAATRGD